MGRHQRAFIATKQRLSEAWEQQTPSAYMTCMAMSGNGAWINTTITITEHQLMEARG
jgi:hypothetical protein